MQGNHCDKENLRLWKINTKLEDLKKFLIGKKDEIVSTNKLFDISCVSFLECIIGLIIRCPKNLFGRTWILRYRCMSCRTGVKQWVFNWIKKNWNKKW